MPPSKRVRQRLSHEKKNPRLEKAHKATHPYADINRRSLEVKNTSFTYDRISLVLFTMKTLQKEKN